MSIFKPTGLRRWRYLATCMETILEESSKSRNVPGLSKDDVFIVENAVELFDNALRGDAFATNFNNESFPSNPIESGDAYECAIGVMLSLNTDISVLTTKLNTYKKFLQKIKDKKGIASEKNTLTELQLFFKKLSDIAEKEDYMQFNTV